MSFIGSIEQFTFGDDFEEYLERVEQLFLINKIEEANKVALFLTLVGPETYKRIKSILLPDKPTGKAFKDLVKVITPHFKPEKNIIAERFKFYNCTQQSGESVGEFIVKLKLLAVDCTFGTFLTEALRDRLVCGVSSSQLQTKLLSTSDLTWDNACKLAQSFELVDREQKTMQPQLTYEVHKINHQQKTNYEKCSRCTSKHAEGKCPAKNWNCFHCGKKGHSAKACYAKNNRKINHNYQVEENYGNDLELKLGSINWINQPNVPVLRTVDIDGKSLKMEVDTGAVVSVISNIDYTNYFHYLKLYVNKYPPLQVLNGSQIIVLGEISVTVSECKLTLLVVKTERNFIPLMGRNWLDSLYPSWRNFFLANNGELNKIMSLKNYSQTNVLEDLKRDFPSMFIKNSKPITHFSADISVRPDSPPKFFKPYSVPLSLKKSVEDELKHMCDEGFIQPVCSSDWAAPIVCVLKKDSSVRICGNFKITINPFLETNVYPLPLIDDILTSLKGNTCFSIIDLSQAYLQLLVNPSSRSLLTINTHLGLFEFCRLPFGVTTAPMIFQRVMDQIMQGLDGVAVYLDDILVYGISREESIQRLYKVFERLRSYNVRINWEKCKLLQNSIEYLGHVITPEGIRPSKAKMDAIMLAPEPENIDQLQSFLGLINYYAKFLPNSSTILAPLYNLLRKDTKWFWDRECSNAFKASKHLLCENDLLVHFDPSKQIVIACDASPYGVGAILSVVVDGKEKPCFMVSSTLSKAERNYSQIHREALAVIFAIKRFHKFVYGYNFIVYTDHQPLEKLLGDQKALSNIVSVRFHRWILFLSNYNCHIKYRPGVKQQNVDALSRLPQNGNTDIENLNINFFNFDTTIPISLDKIVKFSEKDVVICKIINFIREGHWPKILKSDTSLLPYFHIKNSLEVQENCLFYADRLVIPSILRDQFLHLLHDTHVGIVRMKLLARSFIWWPSIDSFIEKYVANCSICQKTQNKTKDCPNFSWPPTTYPFERVHVDLFQYQNTDFLIVVDDYSKWIDVHILLKTNTITVVDKLKYIFSYFGFCRNLVSDNGPQFRSDEFRTFLKCNGIQQMFSPAYHPESNGLAERGVQTVKRCLKACFLEGKEKKLSTQNLILNFLFKYRNTPSTVTEICPSELIFSYKPLTLLSYCVSKSNSNTEEKKLTSYKVKKENENQLFEKCSKSKIFNLKEGEKILYLNPNMKDETKWVKGFICKRLSKTLYVVEVNKRRRVAHRNQIKPIDKNIILEVTSDTYEDLSDEDEWFDAKEVGSTTENKDNSEKSPLKYRLRKLPPVNYKN